MSIGPGQVIAWLAVVVGGGRIITGFSLAGSGDPASIARYLGSDTTGEAIDQGLMLVVFGVALGILTEISKAAAGRVQGSGKGA
jgi:hypothetical protein